MPSEFPGSPSGFQPGDFQPASCETLDLIREYMASSQLAEIVYRDDAGQIQLTHDIVRDFFSRAGQEFLCLKRGQLLRLDHILTLDGHSVTVPAPAHDN